MAKVKAKFKPSPNSKQANADRAREAVKQFRVIQPTLTGFAKALTRNPSIQVVADAGDPRTDGKRIYIRPSLELADVIPHQRQFCDKRDDTKALLCPACKRREELLIVTYHEISHIAYESFAESDDQALLDMMNYAIAEAGGSEYAEKVKKRIDAATYDQRTNYIMLASLVNEFLPVIFNALEDARVNREMFRARPGTKVMMDALMTRVFTKGVEQPDGEYMQWRDYATNAQMILGTFVIASGYDYSGWFCEQVERDMADPELNQMINRLSHVRSAQGVYNLSFKVLDRLRALGYCQIPEHGDSDKPADQPREQTNDEDQQGDSEARTEHEDDGAASDAGSTGDDSGEPSAEDSASSGSDPEEGDDSEDQADDDSDEGGSAASEGDEAGPESEPDPGDSGDGDLDEDGPADREGAGPQDEQNQSGSEDAADDSAGSDSDGHSDPSDGGQQDSDSDESGSGVDGSGDISYNPSSDSADNSDSGSSNSQDQDSDSGEGDAGAQTGSRHDAPGAGEAQQDSGASGADEPETDRSTGESHQDTSESRGEPEQSHEEDRPAQETGGELERDDSDGWDEPDGYAGEDGPAKPIDGTADDVRRALGQLGRHDEGTHEHDHPHLTEGEIAEIKKAITQLEYFEGPSENVTGVEIFKHDQLTARASAWRNVFFGMRPSAYLGEGGDFYTPQSVLGPALLKMRVAFAENKRGKVEHNRKSGRIDGRVLGRRVHTDDARLFRKKTLPGKRDYFVVIGIDVSGSTAGMNLMLAKRAAMAQAELCQRTGVKFSVYAHSAGWDDDHNGMSMLIYEVKNADEPWNDNTKTRLCDLSSDQGNLDGHTIGFYRRMLDASQATDKVMLYYTDGAMPASNYEEELEVLKTELAICKKKGYTVLGVGIRTDSPTKHGLETVQVDDDADLIKVVNILEKRLLA
jgi:hypothetical protein